MTSQEFSVLLHEQLSRLTTIAREEGVVPLYRPLPVPVVRPFVADLSLCLDDESARLLIRKDKSKAEGFLAIAHRFVASLKSGKSSAVPVAGVGADAPFFYVCNVGKSYLDALDKTISKI
jgi:hypothetical protein